MTHNPMRQFGKGRYTYAQPVVGVRQKPNYSPTNEAYQMGEGDVRAPGGLEVLYEPSTVWRLKGCPGIMSQRVWPLEDKAPPASSHEA